MLTLQFLPIVLAALLLAAHFRRGGEWLALAAVLALPVLLAIRQPWAARLIQALLLLGALEWVRTGLMVGLARQAAGAPWLRMAGILGAVALGTGLSAWVFRCRRTRAHFGLAPLA